MPEIQAFRHGRRPTAAIGRSLDLPHDVTLSHSWDSTCRIAAETWAPCGHGVVTEPNAGRYVRIGAIIAAVSRTRSSGARATWSPRRPALTYIRSRAVAE